MDERSKVALATVLGAAIGGRVRRLVSDRERASHA